jgi:hypothetical protein
LPDVREQVGTFDSKLLVHPWKHRDLKVDQLAAGLQDIVAAAEKMKTGRADAFEQLWRAANRAAERSIEYPAMPVMASRASVPYLNEPWYC